jgi:hypothetical protein
MFCSYCGTALISGARFCGTCGSGTDTTAAPVIGPPSSMLVGRPLSAATGVVMGIGLYLCLRRLSNSVDTYTRDLTCFVVFAGTGIWVGIDSARNRVREHKTQLAAHGFILFISVCTLWYVMFPWYLVVRSKIVAGQVEKRDCPQRFGWAALTVPGLFWLVLLLRWAFS